MQIHVKLPLKTIVKLWRQTSVHMRKTIKTQW